MGNTGIAFGIGPWIGGLNLGPFREVKDNELTECINFDILADGVLKARDAFTALTDATPSSGGTAVATPGNGMTFLGLDTVTNEMYAQFQTGGNHVTTVMPRTGLTSTTLFTTLTSTPGLFCRVIRYNGYMYFIPGSATGVNGTKRLISSGVFTAIATIPCGGEAVLHKDRIWIAKAGAVNNKVQYSAVTNPDSWPAANFILVGDESPINSIVALGDTLYIFKTDSTWRFDFTTSPGTDGYLQKIDLDQGATATYQGATGLAFEHLGNHRDCVTIHDDTIYLINTRSVYRFINGRFEDIGAALRFSENFVTPVSIQSINPDKILVGISIAGISGDIFRSSFKFYCYHVKANAWSEYQFQNNNGTPQTTAADLTCAMSNTLVSGLNRTYFLGLNTTRLYFIQNAPANSIQDTNLSNTTFASNQYSIITSEYDANEPVAWKRLYWFGFEFDVLTGLFAVPNLTPWDIQLLNYTDNLAGRTSGITTAVTGSSQYLKSKAGNGLGRFRTIRLQIKFTTGSGPIRVYGGRYITNLKRRIQKSLV